MVVILFDSFSNRVDDALFHVDLNFLAHARATEVVLASDLPKLQVPVQVSPMILLKKQMQIQK